MVSATQSTGCPRHAPAKIGWSRLWVSLACLVAVGASASARADSRVLVIGFVPTTSASATNTATATATTVSATAGESSHIDLGELDQAFLEHARLTEHLQVHGETERASALRAEFRCASLDDACLERIAERRQVDRIIHGSVAYVTTDDSERLDVSIAVFDLYTRATRETIVGSIESRRADSTRHVAGLVEKLVSLVVRVPEEGTATIRAIAGSSVFLDERAMGTVPASGELVLRPLRVGRRALRVVRPNHSIWEAPIVVRTRESIQVTVDTGASVASFDEARATETSGASHGATGRDGAIHPPPDYILAVPGSTTVAEGDVFHAGPGVADLSFHIPLLDEHMVGGELRTTTHARLGWLPRVSSSGARVTAKLRF
jgi:hypothetical protein